MGHHMLAGSVFDRTDTICTDLKNKGYDVYFNPHEQRVDSIDEATTL